MKLYLNSLLRGLAFAAVLSVGTAASAQAVKANTGAAKQEVKSCCEKGAKKAACQGKKAAAAAGKQVEKTQIPTLRRRISEGLKRKEVDANGND